MNRSIPVLAIALVGATFADCPVHAQPPPDRPPEQAADDLAPDGPGPDGVAPDSVALDSVAPDDAEQPAAAPADWFETRLAIEEASDAGDYAAAAALGDRLLELAAAEFGPNSQQVAEAHLLLARVHRRDKDYEAAEKEILSAIDTYEAGDGPLSPELIDPYLDLGDNYGAAGDYASALSAYGAARNIGRRNFGLLNEDQIQIIDAMSDAAEKLDQIDEAKELQLEAVTLVERNHGETSLAAIDADYKYASWLRDHRLFQDERRIYFEIERTISQHYAGDPLMTVRVLRARAASFRAEDNGESVGLGGLRDAVSLLEKMPDPPTLLLAQVYLEIGDWNVEFNRGGALGDDYLKAWQLLGTLVNGDELRRQWFDDLIVVEMSALSRRGLTTDEDAPMGYVIVYFTVEASGRTTDVEVTDSHPPGFKDSAVLQLIRNARFRPRIVDGEFIPMRRAYRFEFRYEPPDEGERKD